MTTFGAFASTKLGITPRAFVKVQLKTSAANITHIPRVPRWCFFVGRGLVWKVRFKTTWLLLFRSGWIRLNRFSGTTEFLPEGSATLAGQMHNAGIAGIDQISCYSSQGIHGTRPGQFP